MSPHRFFTILTTALLFAASGPCFPDTPNNENGCSLIIKLKDGSRISGKSLDDGWQFHSDALGDFKPNMSGIRSIEMATDGDTAQLIGSNGDKLSVRFSATTLPVDTSFGKIDLPVNSIRTIKVLGAGNPKTLPAGLVALWSAEGNGVDLIGEHNAVPQGNVTYEPGVVGRAFGLDGHSAYLRIPASPQLDVGAGEGLTITAWVRPSAFDEAPGHGQRGPIIEWDSDSNDGVSLWASGDNSLTGHLKTPTTDGRATALRTANGALHSGEWQLVALTYDRKSGAVALYVDGVVVKSDNFGSIRAETTYPINIGRRTGQPIGNGESYGGLLDELAIYNRALTAAEIQDIYKALAARKLPAVVRESQPHRDAPKLIGWWPLNEGEGTLVNDHSSSKPRHDGQIISGAGPVWGRSPISASKIHLNGESWSQNEIKPSSAEVLTTELRLNQNDRSGPSGAAEPAKDEKLWDNSEPGQKSLNCDGQHYVSLGNIHQGSFNEITIACWVKHSSSGWQDVVERGSWDQGDGIGLCMDYNGSSATFGHYPEAIKSKAVVQDNRWHHIAGTMRRDGNDYVYSIYVDGKLDNTATGCSRGMSASTGKWTIGARDGGTWSYQGLVNDVRLYDGALSEEDIKKIYQEKDIHDQAATPAPAADAKDDPISKLIKKFEDSHGEWINGKVPKLDLPPTATSDEVLLRIIAVHRLGTNIRTLEVRKDWPIEPEGDHYTAALIEVDAGKRIILFRKSGDSWWGRVFDLP